MQHEFIVQWHNFISSHANYGTWSINFDIDICILKELSHQHIKYLTNFKNHYFPLDLISLEFVRFHGWW